MTTSHFDARPRRSTPGTANYRHGHKPQGGASPEYIVWNGMRARCYNPNSGAYHRYGGRGITVCERWRTSFTNFLKDMGTRPSALHTLERVDNDHDYTPDNCRWATRTEQANNRRSSRIIEFRGEERTVAEWALVAGIQMRTLHWRLQHGWDMERAMTDTLRGKD